MREVVRGDKHNLSKSANRNAQISHVRSEWHWFVRCDLQIYSGCVCHLEQLHAQSPFLFPIVFSINIWTIFTSSRMISFDIQTLSGPKQGLSVDSLFLISFSCWERDEETEKRQGERQKKPKRHQSTAWSVAVSVDVGHAGAGDRELDQSPRTSP